MITTNSFNIHAYFLSDQFDAVSLKAFIDSGITLSPLTECFLGLIDHLEFNSQKIQCLARLKQAITLMKPVSPEEMSTKGSMAKISEKIKQKVKKTLKIKPELNPLESSLQDAEKAYAVKKKSLTESLEGMVENCCMKGDLPFLKNLQLIGAHFNFHTVPSNFSPIHFASQNGHEEVALWLIEQGADVKKKTADELAVIHFACNFTHFKLVKKLLENGVDPNVGNKYYMNFPLHYACANGIIGRNRTLKDKMRDARLALYLYAHKANPSVYDNIGKKPIENFGEDGEIVIRHAFKPITCDAQTPFNIPQDVWKIIFRNLDPDSLFSAHCVSKKLRQIISSDLADHFIAGKIWVGSVLPTAVDKQILAEK